MGVASTRSMKAIATPRRDEFRVPAPSSEHHKPRRAVQPGGDTPVTVLLVADDGSEVILARLRARADLAGVDALARIALAARRCGYGIRLRDVSHELRGLLEFVGLADLLALEPRGKPELREELRIEEVVEPGDAAV